MACPGIAGMSEQRDKWGKVIEQRNANQRAYTARNSERLAARRRERYATDAEFRERKMAGDRAYRQRYPHRMRERNLRTKYGITIADFDRLSAEQGGKCAVCDRVPAGHGKSGTLHVDHCHELGVIRGLLCDSCNRAIGLLGDSPAVLAKASMYLVRHKSVRESA